MDRTIWPFAAIFLTFIQVSEATQAYPEKIDEIDFGPMVTAHLGADGQLSFKPNKSYDPRVSISVVDGAKYIETNGGLEGNRPTQSQFRVSNSSGEQVVTVAFNSVHDYAKDNHKGSLIGQNWVFKNRTLQSYTSCVDSTRVAYTSNGTFEQRTTGCKTITPETCSNLIAKQTELEGLRDNARACDRLSSAVDEAGKLLTSGSSNSTGMFRIATLVKRNPKNIGMKEAMKGLAGGPKENYFVQKLNLVQEAVSDCYTMAAVMGLSKKAEQATGPAAASSKATGVHN